MVVKKTEKKNAMVVPADVPSYSRDIYLDNMKAITKGTNRFFMFATDQKMEHLNADFYGEGISRQAQDPEHLFKIAHQGSIGAMATHAGLIARYGSLYPDIDYIVKLNGKTNLGDPQVDPRSELLWDITHVLEFACEKQLQIRGVGYTIYLGGAYEYSMLNQAARVVAHAHECGLAAILWIYIRAAHIDDNISPELIAGAAGLGNVLGADFVKVHVPRGTAEFTRVQALQTAAQAAGNTGVICSGGTKISQVNLLQAIYEQIHVCGMRGCAIGRNIFQRDVQEAVMLAKAIYALVYQDAPLQDVLSMVKEE